MQNHIHSSAPATPTGWRASDSAVKRTFARSRLAQLAVAILALLIFGTLFAPWLAWQNPFDSSTLDLTDALTEPWNEGLSGSFYVLGADDQGRDILSAILYGLRMSILVGVSSVALSLVIGVPLGLICGYIGGWFDTLVMRVADIQLTFPAILVALMVFGIASSLLPPDAREGMALWVIVISIGLSGWVQYARTVRGIVLLEKHKDYVLAAQLIGRSRTAILTKHILPNLMAPLLVIATINFALAIVGESTLSYLGVGLPPTQPSLGTLIRIGQDFLFSGEWWILLFPSLVLLALALSVNLVGDWLRDALNPKLQ